MEVQSYTKETLPMACGSVPDPTRDLPGDLNRGCLAEWFLPNNPTERVSTDQTQHDFYRACLLAKKHILNNPISIDGTVTTVELEKRQWAPFFW